MKKLVVICLLCILPAIAQAEDKSKRAQVEDLLALMNVDSIVDTIYTQMGQVIQNMGQQLGVKPSEQELYERYTSRMVALMREEMNWEKMKNPMIDLYLKHYTAKEIQDMATFYNSDTGRSMIEKMPAVMRDSMMISQNMVKDFFPKMEAMAKELEEDLKLARNKQP